MLYGTFTSMKNLAPTMTPSSGTNAIMVLAPLPKPNKSNPITNNASCHVTPPSPPHRALKPLSQHANYPSQSTGRIWLPTCSVRTDHDATYGLNNHLPSTSSPPDQGEPPNGIKSQQSLPAPRPRDIYGVPTLVIDATPERSTLMHPMPIIHQRQMEQARQ